MGSIKYLLATWLACVTVAAVEAGSWSHLPAIPTQPDRRAQYSLLLRDGAYKYGLDTGAGFWAKQAGDPANRVTGAYQWTAPDGTAHGIQYTADEHGFQPQPIPQPSPQVSAAPSVDASASTSSSSAVDTTKSAVVSSAVGTSSTGASGTTVDTTTGFSTFDASQGNSKVTADASHGFSFNDGNYQHKEMSDAHSNVIGSYQYTSDKLHNVHYSSGAGTGYVATVDSAHFPVHPVYHPIVPVVVHTQRLIPVFPVLPAPGHPPVVAPAPGGDYQSTEQENGDATYMFSYATDTHSRDESSDAQGNVKGVFSFVDANGVQQTVEYEANNESGFVVKKVTTNTATTSAGNDDIQQTLIPVAPPRQEPSPPQAPLPPQEPSSPQESFSPQEPLPPNQGHLPVTGLGDEVNDNSDASYSFSYNAGDHSRTETSDSKGSIQGSYTFVSKDDGATRRVDYTAGANKGFIAKGSHLPTANDGITISNSLLNGVAPLLQQQALPLAPLPLQQNQGKAHIRPDGSYTFSYATNDHSRSETSDSRGNVQGFYTVGSANGGDIRRIEYTAGADTGFVVAGDGVAPNTPIQAQNLVPIPLQTQSQLPTIVPSDSSSETLGALDGSYAFAFQANDHSREESADSGNTVKGSYTFISKDDNVNHRVDYLAGAKTGFIAKLSKLDGQTVPQVSSEVSSDDSREPPSISSQTNSKSTNEPAVITSQVSDESSGQQDGVKAPPQISSDTDTLSQFSTTTLKPEPIIKSAIDTNHHHVPTPIQPNLVLYTYLPPNSHKFGYILDTIH